MTRCSQTKSRQCPSTGDLSSKGVHNPFPRYEDENSLGNQALFLNAGKKPDDCKMVAKALFSFQAQNNRELSFKKGDVIYIKKQVDSNWYEGERNAMLGIFPTTYVEILPLDSVSQVCRTGRPSHPPLLGEHSLQKGADLRWSS